jgi:hypothetical protein
MPRQLTADETRIYAAGMAARRRGETRPAELLPKHLYYLWRRGWERVGKKPNFPHGRSINPDASVNSPHMVRTEVQTLDDALELIRIQQRNKKASATLRGRPVTWQQELHMHNIRKKSPLNNKSALVIYSDGMSELEARQVARVHQAIKTLSFAVEEMSAEFATPMQRKHPALTPRPLINVIEKLCHIIQTDMPSFTVERQNGQKSQRRLCSNCGGELMRGEAGFCFNCSPETESARVSSQLRREHYAKLAGMESDAKELGRLITRMEKAIK